MSHLKEVIKSLILFTVITFMPVFIFFGGKIPEEVLGHPVFQFFGFFVFAFTMAPHAAHFLGGVLGIALFHPDRPNVDKPKMSHILTLRNKRLYKEAEEELRMLNERYPEEIEPYKMLLHLTAHELPDRSLFDLTYRKGSKSLPTDELKKVLKEYRDEHIQHKKSKNEDWAQTSHKEVKKEVPAPKKDHLPSHSGEQHGHISDHLNIEKEHTPIHTAKPKAEPEESIDNGSKKNKRYKFNRRRAHNASSIHTPR